MPFTLTKSLILVLKLLFLTFTSIVVDKLGYFLLVTVMVALPFAFAVIITLSFSIATPTTSSLSQVAWRSTSPTKSTGEAHTDTFSWSPTYISKFFLFALIAVGSLGVSLSQIVANG